MYARYIIKPVLQQLTAKKFNTNSQWMLLFKT